MPANIHIEGRTVSAVPWRSKGHAAGASVGGALLRNPGGGGGGGECGGGQAERVPGRAVLGSGLSARGGAHQPKAEEHKVRNASRRSPPIFFFCCVIYKQQPEARKCPATNLCLMSSAPEGQASVFVRKDWLSLQDSNNSSYVSNNIIIDTSMLANSIRYCDYRGSYLLVPLLITLTASAGTDFNPAEPNTSADCVISLKNFYASLIHSVQMT